MNLPVKRNLPKKGARVERLLKIQDCEIDQDDRTIRIVLSSEYPVRRKYGDEVLSHEPDAIDMTRAENGLVFLWNHQENEPIGRIRDFRLKNKQTEGSATFSKNSARAEWLFNEVRDGNLTDISISYDILDYIETDTGILATRWMPVEGSLVSVGADPNAGKRGIDIITGESTMTDDTDTEIVESAEDQTDASQTGEVVKNFRLFKTERARAEMQGAKKERQRIAAIRSLFDSFEENYGADFAQLRRHCEDNIKITPADAKDLILDAFAQRELEIPSPDLMQATEPTRVTVPSIGQRGSRVEIGSDSWDTWKEGAELSLRVRSGAEKDKEIIADARKGEFLSMSMTDLARAYLAKEGQPVSGTPYAMVGRALLHSQRTGISHATGHFTAVLENVANKGLSQGFELAAETWDVWANVESLNDFKQTSLVKLSGVSTLPLIRESGEYEHLDVSDRKELIQLAKYGGMLTLSREAIVNDDLNAFNSLPFAMGEAASAVVGDVVYSVLTTNAAMNEDSVNLFDTSTHGNLAASGAAPSVATVGAGETAMATQTDPQGRSLGIQFRYLIVPMALKRTAMVLAAAQYDPAGTAGTLPPNPYFNTFTPVADHRLDSTSTTAWYLAAARDTVTVGFLNGQREPYLESKEGWNVDGVEWKVRQECAAAARDWRTMYSNPGA